MTGTLDVKRDHAGLIRAAARLLSPQGILLFSTTHRRFKFDPALAAELGAEDITKRTIPPDFSRTPRIHTCFRVTALPAGATTAPRLIRPGTTEHASPDERPDDA